MARRVFYSFHYAPDNWRASQVRNIGTVEGNQPAKDNDWETVTKGGDKAIEDWISDQMDGRSCVVVLIGSGTANRKWINHEIVKAWNDGKGILGVEPMVFFNGLTSGLLGLNDVFHGLIKSVVFGVTVSFIALYQGFEAQATPEGVSRATTRTVVQASLAVLGLDFLLTALMFSL